MKKKPSKQPKKQNKREKKKKTQYRVRNWREYNQALVDRGSIFFWITEEALRKWQEQERTGKRGKPRMYSATAIETALTLQQVFHLPLRGVEGFLASILKKLGSERKAPDYSTLSIRGGSVSVNIRVRPLQKESLHIVIDSTGAKVYGEGEWKVRQHGWSKHRTWKKLHIGIDSVNGDIIFGEATGNNVTDGEMVKPLFAQLPLSATIDQVSADGAYDKRACYDVFNERNVTRIAIPPQRNAKIWRHGNTRGERLARDENIRQIRKKGKNQWKQEINYHKRSLVETTMFRLKTIFTDKVQARGEANQRVQLLLRCKALNLMTTLGMPDSYVVA